MTGWNRLIQETVDEIDRAIRAGEDEALTLADGWRVTGQFSDLPAARLAADGRVSLPGGAGLLLTLER